MKKLALLISVFFICLSANAQRYDTVKVLFLLIDTAQLRIVTSDQQSGFGIGQTWTQEGYAVMNLVKNKWQWYSSLDINKKPLPKGIAAWTFEKIQK